VIAGLSRLRALWARWCIARRTRAELQWLDSRALNDLGLDRSQIPAVAKAVSMGRACRGVRGVA
jgi:uncharacterized protein YjiS (DUF1127 family)